MFSSILRYAVKNYEPNLEMELNSTVHLIPYATLVETFTINFIE